MEIIDFLYLLTMGIFLLSISAAILSISIGIVIMLWREYKDEN